MTLLLVMLGGALGAAARFLVDRAVSARLPRAIPLGTLCVNLAGSLALGLAAGAFTTSSSAYAMLATGVCGAFTTWSTLAVEVVDLLRARPWLAVGYLTLTLVAGVVLAFIGLVISGALPAP